MLAHSQMITNSENNRIYPIIFTICNHLGVSKRDLNVEVTVLDK